MEIYVLLRYSGNEDYGKIHILGVFQTKKTAEKSAHEYQDQLVKDNEVDSDSSDYPDDPDNDAYMLIKTKMDEINTVFYICSLHSPRLLAYWGTNSSEILFMNGDPFENEKFEYNPHYETDSEVEKSDSPKLISRRFAPS